VIPNGNHFQYEKIMQVIDETKLWPTLQAYAKAWDDHNNYAQMLINTKIFNKYLM
jgi:hypothetical protein